MKKFLLSSLVICFACTAAQADYSQSFEVADGTTDLGDGSAIWSNDGLNQVLNGQLRMTENGTNSSNASFKVPAQAGSAAGWVATFDLSMEHAGGNTPADGLSFSYGLLEGDTGNLAAEEGWSDGVNHLAFQVDTWKWDDPGQDSGWAIRSQPATDPAQDSRGFAFTHLINEEAIIGVDDAVSGRVAVSYNGADNTASFRTSGFRVNAAFDDVPVPAGFTPDDAHQFAVRARTGGHNQTSIIDNLSITTGAPASFCDASAADVCYDFDSDEGVAVFGDGEVRAEGGFEGGYLKVTDAANGQRGKVIVPDSGIGGQFVFGGRTGGANAAHHIDNLEASVNGGRVDISAKLRVGGGTDRPADGFSFNFVKPGDPTLAEDTNGWAGIGGEPNNLPEEGTTTGISIGFDEWQSGPNAQDTGKFTEDDVVGLSLRVDGQLIGQAPLTTLNGALEDVTSLQTGPNDDGINNLGWADLTISAPLEGANLENTIVTWKGERVEFVPEPASGLLALMAIGSLLMFRRKK